MKKMDEKYETERAAAFLRRVAAEPAPRLPTAAQVWWRAEVIRRLVAKETTARRAARPAVWGQAIATGVVVLSLALAAGWGLSSSGLTGTSLWVAIALVAGLAPVVGVALLVLGNEP